MSPRYVLKIHSSRLRKAGWNLTLTLSEARLNDEVIALADSQVLRWIDQMNGVVDAEERVKDIKKEIKRIRKEANSAANKKEIRRLYDELDSLQYKPDYLCLIIDKEKDYYRACQGFSVNGIQYKRLVGTNGGIKNSTIVFVNAKFAWRIRNRIDCGRNLDQELVTAKLEAYQALTCSASIPVSRPDGILVVPDCITHFKSDIIYLTDERTKEPKMEERRDADIELNASDGCGLMLPSLAERWSRELGLDYTMSGCCIRNAWAKGMAFTFDFRDFADKFADGKHFVTDAWGHRIDINRVELILTTSMLKLWDGYDSLGSYSLQCKAHGYTFGVVKETPKQLENIRHTNYQYLQSLDLSDEDIEELIAPTMKEIKDVLGGDWRKTVLFLHGSGINEDNIDRLDDDIVKAIMIDHDMVNDPYVQSVVYQQIKNRIDRAKVGVLDVHANYSIVSGDPFSLCQSIFGLEVTGLLKPGEIYNHYWSEAGAEKLACFRSPMTCHNNIRLVHPVSNEDVDYWYRYMDTCTIFNSWDTAPFAMNGMDYDADTVMLTDDRVIVDHVRQEPALMCIQRKAEKKVSTEEDFVRSNIDSFGNEIGHTTNCITSMFELQSQFEPDSEEYRTLDYRIKCGQLYQQNAMEYRRPAQQCA